MHSDMQGKRKKGRAMAVQTEGHAKLVMRDAYDLSENGIPEALKGSEVQAIGESITDMCARKDELFGTDEARFKAAITWAVELYATSIPRTNVAVPNTNTGG